jgi:hypothetical protein
VKLFCEHRIPLAAEGFWDLIHSPRYESLVAEAAGLRVYQELERRDEPDAVYRKLFGEPELPDPLRSLLRRIAPGVRSPTYVEEQWRSKSRMEVRWRMQPSVLSDRARIEGVVRVEPRDATSCRRVLEGVVEIDLFGLGRLVERAVVQSTVDAYGRAAEAIQRL